MKATDVVVIGAGIIGSAAAYYLTKAGVDVTLIDRREILASGTASQASAGGVRHQGRDLPEIPLALYSINLWRNLEEELGANLQYRQEGMTIVTNEESLIPELEARVRKERSLGLNVGVVKGSKLHDLVPGLSSDIVAGSYCSLDGHANPMQTTNSFIVAAKRQGARIACNCPAECIVAEKGKIVGVKTTMGIIRAKQVLLAAGAWSPSIAATVGVVLPIRHSAIQMMVTAPHPHILNHVLGWRDHKISLKQVPSGGFVIGGGWPAAGDPDTYQTRLLPESLARSAETTVQLFPALSGVPIVRAWAGFEAYCLDRQPVIGPIDELNGLILAAGFSGHGFALGPGVGSLIARYVTTGQCSELLRPFLISRFNGGNKEVI